jgi:hypothetical protein
MIAQIAELRAARLADRNAAAPVDAWLAVVRTMAARTSTRYRAAAIVRTLLFSEKRSQLAQWEKLWGHWPELPLSPPTR